jgi:hypothetical protein
MSEESNPYQSPQADITPEKPLIPPGVLTDVMLTYLKQSYPWVRFIGIIGFIGCAISVLSGLIVMIIGFVQTVQYDQFRPESILSGLMVIGVTLLMFFPTRFVYIFGTKLRNYCNTNAEKELELAFRNNKSFWKFSGICTIVYLAFIPVTIIIVAIAAASNIFNF